MSASSSTSDATQTLRCLRCMQHLRGSQTITTETRHCVNHLPFALPYLVDMVPCLSEIFDMIEAFWSSCYGPPLIKRYEKCSGLLFFPLNSNSSLMCTVLCVLQLPFVMLQNVCKELLQGFERWPNTAPHSPPMYTLPLYRTRLNGHIEYLTCLGIYYLHIQHGYGIETHP